MDRIKDYLGFAVWFVGLGYVVLWPVTASELGGQPFGAWVFCRDKTPAFLDFLCNSPHSLWMGPQLHVLGFMSTMFVTIRLLCGAVKRSRREARAAKTSAPAAQAADVPPPPRKPRPQHPQIKPRTEFGLRGVPR